MKRALVTGGSGGIGAAVARRLARAGLHVVVHANRNREAAEETAEMADFHLAIRPGTDAWCLAALAALIVQENLVAREWIAEHTTGYAELEPVLAKIPVSHYAEICGVDESLLRQVAQRIARAGSVSMMEDLGLQMNVHSTLGSYLQRLVWLLTGNYARPGTNNAFVPFLPWPRPARARASRRRAGR